MAVKQLERLSRQVYPLGLSIRGRLLFMALGLSVLAASVPLYLLRNVYNLASIHHQSAQKLAYVIKVDDLQTLAYETEHNLRAYATGGSPSQLQKVRMNRVRMRTAIEELSGGMGMEMAPLVRYTSDQFEHWDAKVLNPAVEGAARGGRRAVPQALREPNFIAFIASISQLERNLHLDSAQADNKVTSVASRTRLIVFVGGVIFIAAVTTLIVALWNTLVPGFQTLLEASGEIKSGRLHHRIVGDVMRRNDEFTALGVAFNEMAESLAEQNEKLMEMSRLKTDFVSTVSHELRTPLTAIKGGLGLVLGGVTGELPKDARALLETTAKNTDRLIRLINDVLDVSKIEAGALKLHLGKHGVSDLVGHAVESMEMYARNHGVTMKWEPRGESPRIVVDRDRFEQILMNLLSNAIKFSPEGSAVSIDYREDGDRVTFVVRDQGPGIAADKQPLLFRKFQQFGAVANKAVEGTGLGLAICKSLVEEHGGRIWVESVEGHGSSFFFTLPWNGTDRSKQSLAA